ncbi:unnamed protein product [Meganyctiphanes norvegica]|uniref:UPAR/Ly6 domain-containing protein n=1 Tax=Meganyctiphanes norvegica TaxID=48144 RepID=A0AAV2RQR6_MEGNR
MASHAIVLAVYTSVLAISGAQSLWCYSCPEGCDYFYFHRAAMCADDKDTCIKVEQEGESTIRGCSNKGVCQIEGLLVEGVSAIANVLTNSGSKDAECCEDALCNGDHSQTIAILVPVLFLILIVVVFCTCIGCIIKLCCCICRK